MAKKNKKRTTKESLRYTQFEAAVRLSGLTEEQFYIRAGQKAEPRVSMRRALNDHGSMALGRERGDITFAGYVSDEINIVLGFPLRKVGGKPHPREKNRPDPLADPSTFRPKFYQQNRHAHHAQG